MTRLPYQYCQSETSTKPNLQEYANEEVSLLELDFLLQKFG